MLQPKELFVQRMSKLLPDKADLETYLEIIHKEPVNSIRCNTLKITPEKLKKKLEQKAWKIRQPFKNYPEQALEEAESGLEKVTEEHQDKYLEEETRPLYNPLDYVNLVQLQRKLNEDMRCPAGKNQIYVLSRMKPNGRIRKQPPQVVLDCKIRNFLGWRKRVYADFIKQVCCGDYKTDCEAYRKFMVRGRYPFMQP